MASSYKQAPDNTPSEDATVDLAIGGMNLGAPPNAMVTLASLSAQNGEPGNAQNGGSGDAQAGKPRDAQEGEPGDAQTNTSFIQQAQHDSKGSGGCDASTQPSYHQEPSMVSRSNDKEYISCPAVACPVPSLTQSCLVGFKRSMSRSWV